MHTRTPSFQSNLKPNCLYYFITAGIRKPYHYLGFFIKRKSMSPSEKGYEFHVIAADYYRSSQYEDIPTSCMRHLEEIEIKDLPLYLHLPYKSAEFEKLIQGA